MFQYIVKAKLQPRKLRVVGIVSSIDNGLFRFRIQQPLDNWSKRFSGQVRYRKVDEFGASDLMWGDIFIFQRFGSEYTLHLIRALKAHGKCVIFEIDDLLTDLPDFLAHHKGSPSMQLALRESVRLAHFVTTTTERLANELRKINEKVWCIPNCIQSFPKKRSTHFASESKQITLIVASSDKVFVQCLIEPLRTIQEKHGENTKLIVIGPICEALEAGGLNFEKHPILSYENFKELLYQQTNCIGLIPLDNSLFSSCKSAIKYFDYSSAQIPSICSDVPPYSDHIRNGETGLLVSNTTTAWMGAVETLMFDLSYRQELANAARAYVESKYSVDVAGSAWQSLIEELEVKQVNAPFLVEAARFPPRLPRNALWLAAQLFKKRTYVRIKEIMLIEGFSGIKRRFLG